MDRFGDDLTELILSFLAFEDKVKLQCVSKQWRRVIFNKQFLIEIIDPKTYGSRPGEHNLPKLIRKVHRKWTLDFASLEILLKKCPNLNDISTDQVLEREFLELINKYCPRLKSLRVKGVSDDCFEPSIWKFGQHLECLTTYFSGNQQSKDQFEILVESLNNLNELKITKRVNYLKSITWYPFRKDEAFLPKLESITNFEVNSKTIKDLKVLVDKYCKTLKSLEVVIKVEKFTESQYKTLLSLISRFDNLVDLTLKDGNYHDEDYCGGIMDIDCEEFSKQFGQMFRKLSKLKLLKICGQFVCKNLLKSLTECGSLEQLVTYRPLGHFNDNFDVRQLPVLPNLKVLRVNCYNLVLTERFAAHIEERLPKIQYLYFKCNDEHFVDTSLYNKAEHYGHIYVPLSTIKTLKKVKHIGKYSYYNGFYYGKYVKKVNGDPTIQMLTNNVGLIDLLY